MATTTRDLHADIDEILPGLVADRRFLHQHPELGFEETETARFIAERLASLGVGNIQTGVGGTGVTGEIHGTGIGARGGRLVALRADMDALPIAEENEVDYRSLNSGVMHACGHDAHVTMLLGTARMLSERRDEFAGTVKLLFQPAEEGLGGAHAMVEAGAFSDPVPDAVFGIHIWQGLDLGVVAAREGTAMVAADSFTVTITGVGGHGAQPNLCIDPIAVGAQIVTALQTIVSRENDPTSPAVITVGAFHAGKAGNVIPDAAILEGTIRSVNVAQRADLIARLTDIATGVAAAMRATATVSVFGGVGAAINDAAMTAVVRAAATEVVGAERVIDGPLMVVSEDMSEFLDRAPGCFYFVGSRNPEKGFVWGHHHARFDIDEEAMAIGVETMTRTVLRYFAEA